MSNIFLLFCIAIQFGQSNTGELRLTVNDPGGLPIQSTVRLVSEANQLRQELQTSATGTLVAKRLPFGQYRVEVSRTGFATRTSMMIWWPCSSGIRTWSSPRTCRIAA